MKNRLPKYGKLAILLILIVAAAALLVIRKTPVREAVTPASNLSEQTAPLPAQVESSPKLAEAVPNAGEHSQSTGTTSEQPQSSVGAVVQTEQSISPATKSPATNEQPDVAALAGSTLNPQLREAILSARHTAQKAKPANQAKRQEEKKRKQDQPDRALEWRMMQMVDENGTIAPGALIRAWNQARQMPVEPEAWPAPSFSTSVAGIQPSGWTWLGPGNVGGRVRSIVIHPTDPQTMWAGSVGGGVWKTTDGGAGWVALDDLMANLAIGSLAIDPTNPNVLYAGTGEGFSNGDSISGAGIFKTTDGGTTWTHLTATSTWTSVNRIAIDPTNSQIVLAGTGIGIHRSIDGGATWSNRSTRALDINFHPTDGSKAIASATGSNSARYSIDGGLTWNIAPGIATSGRIEVAYARSNPSIVYASVENSTGQVYKSTNGGQTYTLLSSPQHLASQGWYDNIIWVDPTNENIVIIGGVDLFRSTNGGALFTRISEWFRAPQSAHADHHAIVESPQFDGVNNKTVFFGNDGGVYRAADVYTVSVVAGWQELNNNLGITQFYGGAGSITSGQIVGGTQDNGTLRYPGGIATESWTTMNGGDGGWSAADPTDGLYLYGEFQWLGIHRSSNGGISSFPIYGLILDAGDFGNTNFISPFILDPNNPNTLLAGAVNLWRSTNAKANPVNWAIIKNTIGSNISAIAVAKGNSDIIWVGHNNGNVYYTTNGTAANPTWIQADLGSPALPNAYCTRITIDPTNSSRVYVTFGSFSTFFGKVWRTENNGAAWTDISANLPNAPVRSIVVWEQNPNNLYVGTEVGVFASANGGQSWSPSNDGPTNCSVDELFWMGNTLVAATHGRGMFSINIGLGQSPLVNITSPTTGASFNAGDNVTITATASDPDGTVTKVDFFAGSTHIGTATSSPYTVTWNNVPGGIHMITARATDNSGDTGVSGSVNINVTGGGGCSSVPISIGQTINGSLANTDCMSDDGSFYDLYFFNAAAGQEVAVSMSSSSFNTVLILLSLDGSFGVSDDDGGGGLNSRIPPGSGFITLPTTGTYTIVANSLDPSETGPYSLTLTGGAPPSTIQFSTGAYSVGEGGGAASVTLTRTGSTTAAATINYKTSDTAGLTNCSVINGVASARCDYTTAVGTVRFAAGETSKNISVPIVDDSYAEGDENLTLTLSNAVGAGVGTPGTATLTINDNEGTNGPNPIDGTPFFVRQQYLDFLNREPDPAGYAAWQSVINNCPPNDTTCDRIHVSSSFFRSAEFQGRGYFVYRFYPVALGRKPDYNEFTPDIAKVSGFLSDAELEAAKVAFIAEFMSRPAFITRFGFLNNAQYVDLLLSTAGITHPARDFWIEALGDGTPGSATRTRAQVLREIAESAEVYNKYYNQAFVVMQYFGYLRRQPDGQYLAWIAVLDSTADYRGMIFGFMFSAEYRARFGP